MAGETGVGAAMTDVDNAYKAVAWAKFDAMEALPGAKLVSGTGRINSDNISVSSRIIRRLASRALDRARRLEA